MQGDRARLVRLCARLTGDPVAADDLAQETLLEAWRNRHKLVEAAGRDRWLAAIARNVCRRWLRQQGRERARLVAADVDADLPDAFDVEVDLEREELAVLLDRALGLLPAETRRVLVERYIHDSPHAAIAERLGVSVDAVSMRLARGKLQLRRLLTSELRDEAAAFGLCDAETDAWHETRIWCPGCGRRCLDVRLQPPPGAIEFRCRDCDRDPLVPSASFRLSNAYFARLIGGIERPRPIISRTTPWVHDYFRRALADCGARCTNCGRPVRLRRVTPDDALPALQCAAGLYVRCDACGEACSTSQRGLVGALPEVRRFWRAHPRMRVLSEYAVDAAGRPAIVTRFESVRERAGLAVVSAVDTFEVLEIDGDIPAEAR
jgi:RNA polymerase sigma-70 factor (ECF subfamily)